MILKTPELIREFYEKEKHKYPGVTLEEFKEIIHTPWLYTKKQMESGELPTIRLKYFGTFQVYPGRAKNMLNNLKVRFKNLKIEPERYFKLKTMLEKFIEKNDKKN